MTTNIEGFTVSEMSKTEAQPNQPIDAIDKQIVDLARLRKFFSTVDTKGWNLSVASGFDYGLFLQFQGDSPASESEAMEFANRLGIQEPKINGLSIDGHPQAVTDICKVAIHFK